MSMRNLLGHGNTVSMHQKEMKWLPCLYVRKKGGVFKCRVHDDSQGTFQGNQLFPHLTQTMWLTEAICKALEEGEGLAVGKLGTCEAECLFTALHGHPWNGPLRTQMTVNAGLWPPTNPTLAAWSTHMRREVLPYMDHVVQWYNAAHEVPVLETWAPQAVQHTTLDDLDPWNGPWTAAIPSNTPVAIVTPFATSIAAQLAQPTLPTHVPWSSPPPRFFTVRTGCSPALDVEGAAPMWPAAILAGGWKAAVDHCVAATLAGGARVAIVGCGALSLPIVAALKRAGVVAIHLGGTHQLLFGIRGRRWNGHPHIGEWMRESCWRDPVPEETPALARKVEGACYWH